MEEPGAPKKSHIGLWALITILVLVIYILSPAPVFLAARSIYGAPLPDPAQKTLETIYSPLIALSRACRPVGEFYEFYFKMVETIAP